MKTLVFDLDGTLVDSVPDLASAINHVLDGRGLAGFDGPAVQAMVGDGARALVERALAARNVAMDEAALAEFMVEYTRHAVVGTRPYPGVAETLVILRDAGWNLAVCTNKPVIPAREVLRALGLAEFFSAVGGGDSYPVRKPDPAHLLAVLAEAGGDPARAVMVGADSTLSSIQSTLQNNATLLDSTKLVTVLTEFSSSSVASIVTSNPSLTYDGSGNITTASSASFGTTGTLPGLQVLYPLPVIGGELFSFGSSQNSGTDLLISTAVFVHE